MDNDERKLLEALLTIHKDSNKRIVDFTRYILAVLVGIVLILSISMCYISYTSNSTTKECARLYFTEDYLLPETEVSQTQTIGDIN